MTDCNHELEYYYTMDELLPYGNITSTAVFRCTKCNRIFLEGELDEGAKGKCNNPDSEQ